MAEFIGCYLLASGFMNSLCWGVLEDAGVGVRRDGTRLLRGVWGAAAAVYGASDDMAEEPYEPIWVHAAEPCGILEECCLQ